MYGCPEPAGYQIAPNPGVCARQSVVFVPVHTGTLLSTLYFDTWGGGGCGDPLERETAKVAFDVEAGLVTVAGALRYGVVTSEDGVVDEPATQRLRARMAKERGATQLFDRGFATIDSLKARCMAETSLEPPVQPRFTRRARKAATAV